MELKSSVHVGTNGKYFPYYIVQIVERSSLFSMQVVTPQSFAYLCIHTTKVVAKIYLHYIIDLKYTKVPIAFYL